MGVQEVAAHLAGEEDDGDDGSALDAPVDVVWPQPREYDGAMQLGTRKTKVAPSSSSASGSRVGMRPEVRGAPTYSGRARIGRSAAQKNSPKA